MNLKDVHVHEKSGGIIRDFRACALNTVLPFFDYNQEATGRTRGACTGTNGWRAAEEGDFSKRKDNAD